MMKRMRERKRGRKTKTKITSGEERLFHLVRGSDLGMLR